MPPSSISAGCDCIGVDYSTKKVSAALLRPGGGPHEVFSFAMGQRDTDNRANFIEVVNFWGNWAVDYAEGVDHDGAGTRITVESPIGGVSGNMQTLANMAMVCGAILTVIKFTLPLALVDLVPPATWKKRVLGRGNLDKAGVAAALEAQHPDLSAMCRNQDETDAMCMALYASMEEATCRDGD